MTDHYQVDINALNDTAKGLNDTITELKTLGFDGEATEGRGFGNIDVSAGQMGHDALHQAFSGFCDRWGWGVRTLVQDGNTFAGKLGLSAGAYYEQEQYVKGLMKDAVTAAVSDPHLSDQQAEQMSLAQIAQANTPDYSAKSFEKAAKDAKTTWENEGKDFANSSPLVNPVGAAESNLKDIESVPGELK
ncbi:hypothetical protein [Streptacidiphilus fuscans]|uniref:Uncharacterized protein n=1 Tax=Streptacidiphilus fuscans TaxID=2789292 RepID=A0A931FFN8_9ACTN|nr:hypothetical protein [Streptacidiphilus fuscans]MBF9070475.1 hypothetical protein [Streptacidiphilus fuscans]